MVDFWSEAHLKTNIDIETKYCVIQDKYYSPTVTFIWFLESIPWNLDITKPFALFPYICYK